MAVYSIDESLTATEGQTIFKTTQSFTPGAESVYLNGLHCDKGVHYNATDSNTIVFTEPLIKDDVVSVSFSIIDDKIKLEVIDEKSKNALYKRYSTNRTLKNNMKYSISLIVKGQSVDFTFYSKLSPLYSTVKKIRGDTLTALANVSDEDIAFQIYLNSKEGVNAYIDKLKAAAEEAGTTYTAPTSYPDYLKQWVRYKTDLDMLTGLYISLTAESGTAIKKLGPLDVEKTIKLPLKFMDTLGRIQKLFDMYDNMLNGSVPTSQVFVKGNSTDTYPLNARLF